VLSGTFNARALVNTAINLLVSQMTLNFLASCVNLNRFKPCTTHAVTYRLGGKLMSK
jgi:hypothetical protein